MMNATCNYPGHIKKNCQSQIEICRRCGGDRKNVSDHKECVIKCHHCMSDDHQSTDYKCPRIAAYRKQLLMELKKRAELQQRDFREIRENMNPKQCFLRNAET
ncbi:unnamed protein product [Didymodactylos carnosus]|uniref:Uncharacterized protein n=1 Tax=Didymodactylos carnosus TaxID=1234261 RepID=A0A816ECX3_9BILA|nr:unnamed protein product [Didymodactylos carnosus]CAF4571163.1 unnamed protein product [Didymodactylos carnosus]